MSDKVVIMEDLEEFMRECRGKRSWDELSKALGNQTRRFALYHLIENEHEVINREELAEKVIERQQDMGVEREDRMTLETKLQHSSIPKLQDLGVLKYDNRTGDVVYDGGSDLEFLASIALEYEEEYFSV